MEEKIEFERILELMGESIILIGGILGILNALDILKLDIMIPLVSFGLILVCIAAQIKITKKKK